MKIKLAILDKDLGYLNRMVSVFGAKYSDKLELYSFTDEQAAISVISSAKIDVLVASDDFNIDISSLPKKCGFAYFVDSPDVETFNDRRAICKFQKVDLIYKQILSVYAEKAGNISGLKLEGDSARTIIFSSPCGGTGTSSAAAAFALNFAAKGKKALYLNLENFGSSDIFFNSEGQFDMSDIIFAVKSKKANLALKLESTVKQDFSGVYYFSRPQVALDMLELGCDEIIRIINELKLTGAYDFIVIDIDFRMSKDCLKIYREADSLVWVSDGSETANSKIYRAYEALSITEQNADIPLINRLCLLYNKFSNKTGKILTDIEIKNVGGAPRYEHASAQQVIKQLCKMDMLDKIV